MTLTDRQQEILDAMSATSSNREAAQILGITERSLYYHMVAIKKKQARHEQADPGFEVRGTSTLYDAQTGEAKLQWVKTHQEQEDIRRALEAVLTEYDLPKWPRVKQPKKTNKDLLTVYTITDFHFGMYAWADETGDDWDVDIARRVLCETYAQLMEDSPDSEWGLFNQLGDFLHWDGIDAVTPTSRHILDADTRFSKLVQLVLDCCVLIVERMLNKHKYVKVLMCEGNHDIASSVWLQHSLAQIFRSNPRVSVDTSPTPFYAHKHGKIMLGFHHGHKVKNKSLPSFFSSDPKFRKMWGECDYAYIHTGHYHRTEQDQGEDGGAIVERHPTLAGRDAYAARGGYVSWRGARAITYHCEHGEQSRSTRRPLP